MNPITKHWNRLKRSLRRHWREFRLPRGYARLGTKYGGWWVDTTRIHQPALLIDCGLGEDISFPITFLKQFRGQVLGVEPNPRSLEYCKHHVPTGMRILPMAFWKEAGQDIVFHLPRQQDQLPKGADGVSGSLVSTHEYVVGGEQLHIRTTNLTALLAEAGATRCDVLKIDIEGAEYEILDDLAATGQLTLVDQLLVEFHHDVTHHTQAETDATAAKILACGYELIYIEGRNYIFRKRATA